MCALFLILLYISVVSYPTDAGAFVAWCFPIKVLVIRSKAEIVTYDGNCHYSEHIRREAGVPHASRRSGAAKRMLSSVFDQLSEVLQSF